MKIEKIMKALEGTDVIEEMNNMSDDDLKKRLVGAEQAIRQAKEELEENPKYQQLKEDMKAVKAGFGSVKKFQNAIIQYALIRLEEMGK